MDKFIWKFSEEAYSNFLKLDELTRRHIIKWLDTHINTYSDIKWGKPLVEDRIYLKYIVGKYRILGKVNNREFIVLAIKETKHRNSRKRR